MLDMKRVLRALRANPRRFVHISTGSQYHPRRLSPGHVRPDAAKGETYDVGRNAYKRAKRALHRMGRGLA